MLVSFSEKGLQAKFILILDGMKVERRLNRYLSLVPKNGIILNEEFKEQSIHLGIHFPKHESGHDKTYRFEIKRLPTQILPDKTKVTYEKDKVTIRLTKKVNEPWQSYKDSDFETIHLVKN